MTSEAVDGRLADWLQQASIEVSEGDVDRSKEMIAALAKNLTPEATLDVVGVAYALATERGEAWITDQIRSVDPTLTGRDAGALLGVLASATIVDVLQTPRHKQRVLAMLASESAQFVAGQPAVAELSTFTRTASGSIRRAARGRQISFKAAGTEATQALDKIEKFNPDGPDWHLLRAELDLLADAIRAAAQADENVRALSGTLQRRDEELDTLWWSFGGRNADGKPWSDIGDGEEVAIVAAVDLHGLTSIRPSPPSSRALLSRALGSRADAESTIANAAAAADAASLDWAPLPEHPVVPISSVARVRRSIGTQDDTWATVVTRTLKLDPAKAISLVAASEQLMRELDIRGHF